MVLNFRVVRTFGKVPVRTAFSRSRSQHGIVETPDAPSDALARLGFRHASISSSARWSWKKRAFSATINFSEQEFETSSTTNADAVHCEKMEGGCQNNTTSPVE